jgi:hypothetical protein
VRNSYPARARNLAFRVLNGEAIIMNPADSTLFSLNETATVIWLAADGKRTLGDIVEQEICPHFEIDPETAIREAEEFAASLAGHSILQLSDSEKGQE